VTTDVSIGKLRREEEEGGKEEGGGRRREGVRELLLPLIL